MNIRERLRLIQNSKGNEPRAEKKANNSESSQFPVEGWDSAGYETVKRVFQKQAFLSIPAEFPRALPIIVPDFAYIRRVSEGEKQAPHADIKSPEDMLFFDLETTGLSGGAGTVAFLAAFGRLRPERNAAGASGYQLRVTQYLLLDYPGENDFLEAILKEFSSMPLVVSYNGKSFDSQILKTRCLMNGIQPPRYFHADLLHPARRLWKNLLENCSQATVEGKILDIDRSGDISGAMAPEIWFDFLRNGNTDALMGICEHNRRDIRGLASILAAMTHIADDPLKAMEKYAYDAGSLALRWRNVLRFNGLFLPEDERDLRKTGEELLRIAADKAGQAALVYALDLNRAGFFEEGGKRLLNIANGDFPVEIKTAALRSLAIDAERRLGNIHGALELTEKGLELLKVDSTKRKEFERRAERLQRKINSSRGGVLFQNG
jgi:uncharacterized protein YprB with RNaseH-like and TPR domain